ncbi:hypothetical protein [Paenibacillus sp. MMS18-CY102]|uniref:hypothetical protein n=1 Tax=Paenibacillus sp. MMS18-CY102 TaxID=2682849 RepID=UPI0013666A6B|nr:hypothetical protein [Paenibacillus sp. MMS18-CY102]MWC29839.1 hypothetical protein [Paenibacillus sp. MMS18-CY102]
MRQARLVLVVLAIMSLVSACSSGNTDKIMKSESPVEALDKDQINNSLNNDKNSNPSEEHVEKFSYLKQLPLEKQEAFTRFKSERNLQHLSNFTPEDMVLIYLYCLSIGDPDLLYEITFNGGQLPGQDKFRKDYFDYAMNYDSETAVHYRYYDSIKVDESTAEANKATVIITVSIETMTHSMALGLRKENEVWKLDIYPLIQEYIKKASKNKTKS